MKQKFNTVIVKNYIKNNNLTIKEFCKQCNISYNEYKKFINSDYKLSLTSAINISEFLSVSLAYLLTE